MSEDRLEYWRKKYAGGVVTVKDGGHRLHIRPADEGACWMEVVVASGQVIWVGDFEPVIFRDYTTRSLKVWLERMADFARSPGYGAEKIALGMCCWWHAAANSGDSPIRDMDKARADALEWLNEWHMESICDASDEELAEVDDQHNDAADEVRRAETLQEVYAAVMEVCPDACEADFGLKVPDGLWRCCAAAERMIEVLVPSSKAPPCPKCLTRSGIHAHLGAMWCASCLLVDQAVRSECGGVRS